MDYLNFMGQPQYKNFSRDQKVFDQLAKDFNYWVNDDDDFLK